MKYGKPALTFDEQADQLITRGLLCEREELLALLRSVSHYRLSGYWYPFRRSDDRFADSTTLQTVWRCYTFDRRFHLVVLDAIERIEVCIRTELVYLLAHAQGPFGYLDPANFGLSGDTHSEFVAQLKTECDRSQEHFFVHSAFADYCRTMVLGEETDPDKLHDLKARLDACLVYGQADVDRLAELYLGGADRDRLDPILDACVATYKDDLDEDGQVDFKGKAKAFVRTYEFLASILPYSNAEWEKLSIFLTFLTPKLPAPVEEDLSKGILEAIDMDSYRVEKRKAIAVPLPDEDAEIGPVPVEGGGRRPEAELDRLSNILAVFNEQFGNIEWTDVDRVSKLITEEIPARVAADTAYQNAQKNSDRQNARIEHDKALGRVMTALLSDDTELFKQFSDHESFRRWLGDMVFGMTYTDAPGAAGPSLGI